MKTRHTAITAADLQLFDLPMINGRVPPLLPWLDRLQFCAAMFFEPEVARRAYLLALMNSVIPDNITIH